LGGFACACRRTQSRKSSSGSWAARIRCCGDSRITEGLFGDSLAKLNQDKAEYYSTEDACQKLRLSKNTITKLIKIGILTSRSITGKQNIEINKNSIDKFYKTYATIKTITQKLNISTSCLRQELKKNDIFPIEGLKQKGTGLHIYELNAIKRIYPSIETLISTKKQNHNCHLVSASILMEKYNISSKQFSLLFTSSGFVSYLGVPRQGPKGYHFTKRDARKISRILDKYLTFRQADKLFGNSGLTRSLVNLNKLAPSYPLLPHTKYPMIDRASLLEYMASKAAL
ncbi:helix-turn-helix domain-containing protein, partial [Pseudomonas sp. HTZ1]|uniref:helix-turn-helix domain-containing protein n=1 Tax=Pseudomonas sp. HTZ1 TaxID=3075219 RepID=UPI00287F24D9